MRIYSRASIIEQKLTGFQSPCSEFAQKPLSLDEKFARGNPSLYIKRLDAPFPKRQLFKGDWLLIDMTKQAQDNSLLVGFLDDDVKILEAQSKAELEDVSVGVVSAVFRDYRVGRSIDSDYNPFPSLDENFLEDDEGLYFFRASGKRSRLGMKPGDLILINRALPYVAGWPALVVIKGKFQIQIVTEEFLKIHEPEAGDFIWGMVQTLIREVV